MSIVAMVSPDYLLKHIAAGDGQAATMATTDTGKQSSPLTRYYSGDGYPPGRWIGSGIAGLNAGSGFTAGDLVTAQHMNRLFKERVDPISGKQLLARSTPKYVSRAERIRRRVDALRAKHPDISAADLGAARLKISREESKRASNAVLGFDLTFKPPKSVSALWAVADHGTQVQLYEAHQEAVEATLAMIEHDVLRTRVGAQGVRRIETRGLVAAAFDHWDSRSGDPLLHTHVTVANAVQGKDDGVWRTIDSRGMFKATVAASETYQIFVADAVTRRLGLDWETRARIGNNRAPARELAAVPQSLLDEFSQRSAAIEAAVDEAIAAHKATHGRAAPSQQTLWKMRQSVVLETRTEKHVRSLEAATADWRERASSVLDADPVEWAKSLQPSPEPVALLTGDDVAPADRKAVAAKVVEVVAAKRSVWSRWNLHAETMRQVGKAGWQFTTPEAAGHVADAITAEAVAMSVVISAPQLASVPDAFINPDGTSQLAEPTVYTSRHVLDAEARLMDLADLADGPQVSLPRAEQIASLPLPGRDYALDAEDQAPAAVAITTSGRIVDVLEGPAGTGKTTTMAGVRAMWEAEYGPGSVTGLAPSSKAAEVLSAGLGIDTENTAQWLAQQDAQPDRQARIAALTARLADPTMAGTLRAALTSKLAAVTAEFDRWNLTAGQLLVVDEAGMVGTFALDRLAAQAAAAGAKLLLVGDPKQLAAVEVGGAFGLLTSRRPDTPRLSVIRRFIDDDGTRRRWEESASMAVRTGDLAGAKHYLEHGRVAHGGRDDMVDAAYTQWRADTADGRVSILALLQKS